MTCPAKSLFWLDKIKIWSDIQKTTTKNKQIKQNKKKINTNKHFAILKKLYIYIYTTFTGVKTKDLLRARWLEKIYLNTKLSL